MKLFDKDIQSLEKCLDVDNKKKKALSSKVIKDMQSVMKNLEGLQTKPEMKVIGTLRKLAPFFNEYTDQSQLVYEWPKMEDL